MSTAFEKLRAKQKALELKIAAVEARQAQRGAALTAARQRKLGRLFEVWMAQDPQLARRAVERFAKERWSRADRAWLLGLSKGGHEDAVERPLSNL